MQQVSKKSSKDTLEDQLHIFFQQKKTLLTKKKEYDFAEIDFLVQTRIDADIRARFRKHMRFGEIISGRSLFVLPEYG